MSRSCRPVGAIPACAFRRISYRRALALAVPILFHVYAFSGSGAFGAARDSFEYPVGQFGPANGGTGFAGPWGGLLGSQVVAGSLSDPSGLLATSGNRIEDRNVFAPERKLAGTVGTPGTELWLGFLMRRDRDEPGWFGLQLRRQTAPGSSEGGAYFIGEPGSGAANGTWGVGQPVDDTSFVSSGVPFVANQTTFLVARIQFTAANDPITLFVNPTPGVLPTGGVTYTGTNFQPFLEPTVALSGANHLFDPANPTVFSFDELRVGSSYAEVAPIMPEPSSALMLLALAATGLVRRRRA